jgi:hypothetical protein
MPVHERNRHRAFPHGGCASLHRVVPNVASGEHSGYIRLELVGSAVEEQSFRCPIAIYEVGTSYEINILAAAA